MKRAMRLTALGALAVLGSAAQPDWSRLDPAAMAFVRQYIQVQSVNPPANTAAAANLVKALLESHGIEVKLYPSGPAGQTNLLARMPGRDRSKKPLLLLNHLDVVPVDRAAWKLDPFAGVLRDGFLWGRGALDMKGLGTMHMMALVAMRESGQIPPRDVLMLSTADEETNGDYGIRWMIANHFQEIAAEYVLDEGGFGTREILSPGKLVFGVSVGEKQSVWLRLTAHGTAAHGSQPIPDNANLTLIRAIGKAMALPPSKLHPIVEEMVRNIGPLAENKYTHALRGNTVSLTTLSAGVGSPPKANVIPSVSEATLDCRLLPGVKAAGFIEAMRARIHDPRVSIKLISLPDDPGASNPRTPLFDAIRRAIVKHNPDALVTAMLVPHGTDSVKLRSKGLTAYGLTPMVLDMATAGSMHGDQERIPVAEFYKGLHIFYDLLASEW